MYRSECNTNSKVIFWLWIIILYLRLCLDFEFVCCLFLYHRLVTPSHLWPRIGLYRLWALTGKSGTYLWKCSCLFSLFFNTIDVFYARCTWSPFHWHWSMLNVLENSKHITENGILPELTEAKGKGMLGLFQNPSCVYELWKNNF